MPSVTLGKKRPSEAIVQGGNKPKKLKFTEDGEAVAVAPSTSPSISKVRPDYSKYTKKNIKEPKPFSNEARTGVATLNRGGASLLDSEEIDFPRGGTALTALELREAKNQGVKDANSQIFKENESTNASKKRTRDGRIKLDAMPMKSKFDKDSPRIEYLTYKKLIPGMRILGQVITTTPLSVIVSLPHQLMGHIPVDKITTELNSSMDRLIDRDDRSDADNSDQGENETDIPNLEEIFSPGQYVRAIVTAVHPHGVTVPPPSSESGISLGKPRNELDKASRRVELSLLPQEVNLGISSKDLVAGLTLPAAVVSVEDHGYTLNFGIPNVSGFLPFKNQKAWGRHRNDTKLKVGMLVDTIVKKLEENGRVCTVGTGTDFAEAEIKSLTSTTSIQPGSLVRPLVTSISSTGAIVQVLGLFNGTIHTLHASCDPSKLVVGKKIRARILWDIPSSDPRQFALSTLDHVVKLKHRKLGASESDGEDNIGTVEEVYPVGTILEDMKVVRMDADRWLYLEVRSDLEAAVHISDVSDEHVPSLSAASGPYKVGSRHRVRVTGYSQMDGLLQCSMKESILAQKWLKVSDVKVGEIVKGSIVNLTERGLFVSISGIVHAVVWPNHYADIRLKHPERKFKPGNSIKCRVLLVDPEKNRISLTAKKSLIESTLPIISDVSQEKLGMQTHATIFKVAERVLSVEFYNGVKGIIPLKEATDTSTHTLEGLFNIGQVVKICIIEIKPDSNLLVGSILKAASSGGVAPIPDISNIEVGNTVSGTVFEIHKENIVLTLEPTGIRALLSLNNLANHRHVSVSQLRSSIQRGDTLDDLVVMTKNATKALVIVAAKPKPKARLPASDAALKIEDLKTGQKLPGLVVKHTRKGAIVKLGKHVAGTLHATDVSDDYSTTNRYPAIDSVIQTIVVDIDAQNHQIVLSTRPSRLAQDESAKGSVLDPEISGLEALRIGQTIRGFVKGITDSGLFVSLSRSIDARVQIRELFDEFIKDWKSKFQVEQVVQGRILSVNIDNRQVEMTLRSGELRQGTTTHSLSDFSKGQRIHGLIKRVEEYGVFVRIEGTDISGLCHKSELADATGPSASETLKMLKEGDRVRALILSVDKEKKRIAFGLKPSYFFEEDLQDNDQEEGGSIKNQESSNSHLEHSQATEQDSETDNEAPFQPRNHIPLRLDAQDSEDPGPVTKLELSAPLRWDVNIEEEDSIYSEDESLDEEEVPARKRRKRKHEIQQDMTVTLQNRAPQSSSDFERLLLASPNSSYLWVQFMAFQLQLSEVDKAREVGRRAIRAINFREEQERLNVWMALLNLEVTYGTDTSLENIFKEAARANDPKTIHWRLAILLDDSQKHDKAEEQFRKTCKKFSTSSKVWTLFAEHYFKRSMPDEARQLLQRSLLSLEKRKHLKTISKFAQLEFRMGDPERGRTIFEGIIETHRKRLDLWNVYIDMEAGQRDLARIRGICERAVAMKLSKKKAKFFFKKWLELEKKMGDDAGVEMVKAKAVEWTQNASSMENATNA